LDSRRAPTPKVEGHATLNQLVFIAVSIVKLSTIHD
jgi:hypothetical protein